MNRRTFLFSLGAASFAHPLAALAQPGAGFVMWHAPGCGCCLEWARRMRPAFGAPSIVQAGDMAAIKRVRGVPADLQSCHTAMVGGYVVEGHVPPVDIQRLIASRNRTIKGLAVPGMPMGSPGMDVGHDRRDRFQVIAFAADGRRSVFARHN